MPMQCRCQELTRILQINNLDSVDLQLFERLKKIVDASVKMECESCHKLVPTTQFFQHLVSQHKEDDSSLREGHSLREKYNEGL
jgi:phenylalanine-4-hydroxylase